MGAFLMSKFAQKRSARFKQEVLGLKMTGVQSQSEDMKSETLTQEEALELATTLKQKLSDGEIPNSDLESINRNGCWIR